jgi:DNA processing protein
MTRSPRTAPADAWLALALVEGLPARRARELATSLGGPAAVLDADPTTLGLAGDVAARLPGAGDRARGERETLDRLGARVVAWTDSGYPELLRTISDPPLVLFVRGRLEAGGGLAVAVVGARRAGDYGQRVARELAEGLAQAGITVVSGLATGIDAAAHRGALGAGGHTVAVMATGIDRIYPSWHARLARDIAADGALVTEFACGTAPLHFHFPQRNRIIAGLAVGTVVVEAAEGSGSLITAAYALEQGREVFAVPGPVGTPHHRGCHRLIQQGATLVTSIDDVLDTLAPTLRARVTAARKAVATASLSPDERRVLDALGPEVTHIDVVVARSGLVAAQVLETLLALELRGLVEQRPGMRFLGRRVAA